ncbi:DUF4034 domain-containing protein [Cerasicoccus fimbriatus]|uniref:DUF4034 domain-containing protein n=1 Tax=Cerasicoccus fimbriatus TaxID=3014554 RepID=UPI0022B36DCB|nr:DUF4034 domain-containing protein [Cerasicoccus sp. TK19100]
MKGFLPIPLLASALLLTAGCDFDFKGFIKPDDTRPGPVEHIDADERRQAALLTPTLGPIMKEVRLFRADVRSSFENGNYEALDQQAGELAEGKQVFDNGSWKIHQFYVGIGERFGRSEDQFLHDKRRLERWMEQRPDSTTARIAYADFLTEYAWHARGSGYASTVTNEGWRKFGSRLQEANEVLSPMWDSENLDPYWGSVMLRIALGQGWDAGDYRKLMSYLHASYPKYWGYDVSRAYSLLPRWHGEEGDWERFAKITSERPDGLGSEVYARIIIRMAGFYGNIYRETDAQWAPTKEGLEILLEKYPDSLTILNSAARVAVLGNDQEMAKALFEKIEDNYVDSCWKNTEQFVHYRTWARTGNW